MDKDFRNINSKKLRTWANLLSNPKNGTVPDDGEYGELFIKYFKEHEELSHKEKSIEIWKLLFDARNVKNKQEILRVKKSINDIIGTLPHCSINQEKLNNIQDKKTLNECLNDYLRNSHLALKVKIVEYLETKPEDNMSCISTKSKLMCSLL